MNKVKKHQSKPGPDLQDFVFCFPVFAGVLCVQGANNALCQVLKQGVLRLFSYRVNKMLLWHQNLPFIRGVEALIWGLWVYIKGFMQSIRNFQKLTQKIEKINFFHIFIYFLIFCGTIVCLLICGWGVLGVLPSVICFEVFGITGSLFAQNFCIGIVRCVFLYLLVAVLLLFSVVRALWRFQTAANQIVYKNKFFPLNFANMFFGALLLDVFVVSLLSFECHFVFGVLLGILILAFCFGLVFEVCLWQTKKGGIYKQLCAITSILFYQSPGKTELLVANGAFLECELMKNEEREVVDSTAYPLDLAFVLGEVRIGLQKAGIEDSSEAEWLIANVLGCGKLDLKFVKALTDSQYREVQSALMRRTKHEPLEKIFGFTEFYGLRFKVNKNVLTPRQETELLVESVLKEIQNIPCKVLDLCTGSGAIAVSIAKNSAAEVLGVDISEPALLVAKRNAEINHVDVKFKQSDLFSAIKGFRKFDIIVSNPPYIKTDDLAHLDKEVKNFDPILALDGGADGLYFYQKIAALAPKYLVHQGKLFLEIGVRQAQKVKKLLTDNFEDIKILKDYNGIQRIIVATKKG